MMLIVVPSKRVHLFVRIVHRLEPVDVQARLADDRQRWRPYWRGGSGSPWGGSMHETDAGEQVVEIWIGLQRGQTNTGLPA